jgi:hypothetical protein
MKKICSKCGKLLKYSEFYKNKRAKDGLMSACKYCHNLYSKNRLEEISKYNKMYRAKNKEKAVIYQKAYYKNNRETIIERSRIFRINNRNKIINTQIKYNTINRDNVNIRNNLYSKRNAKYETYKNKLTIDESPRLADDGVSLEVKCKYCNKYFIPLNGYISKRVNALNDKIYGPHYVYCSEGCKKACPTYGQHKYPKGFKKVTSREVQPELRKLVLERDNWECQICGANINDAELHCHHLTGVELNPVESADMDNCVTLCKDCHKKVHKLPGCRYSDYRRKECKED